MAAQEVEPAAQTCNAHPVDRLRNPSLLAALVLSACSAPPGPESPAPEPPQAPPADPAPDREPAPPPPPAVDAAGRDLEPRARIDPPPLRPEDEPVHYVLQEIQESVALFARSTFSYGPEEVPTELPHYVLQQAETMMWRWWECGSGAGGCPDLAARYEAAGLPKPHRDAPVRLVSWQEAADYCTWAYSNETLPEGWIARLPTDAEWERAARGRHPPGRRFPTGQTLDVSLFETIHAPTLPIGRSDEHDRIPNTMRDMVASVEEWVLDASPPGAKAGTDRRQLTALRRWPDAPGPLRGVRGGHHRGTMDVDPAEFESRHRRWADPEERTTTRGFRCAVGPIIEGAPP